MKVRIAGMIVTAAAAAVLLVSLVLGLRRQRADGDFDSIAAAAATGPEQRIRVEVLNGAGIQDLARNVTERLRASGYDVVYYGNAGALARDSSVVLDRGTNPLAVAGIAAELGIPRVEVAVDTSLYLEATVVLGPDWPDLDGP